MSEILSKFALEDLICFVAPNEQLFSDHLGALLRAHQECKDSGGAASDFLISHRAGDEDHADLNTGLNLAEWQHNRPAGMGRFLFRISRLPADLGIVLPYLDALAINILAGTVTLARSRRCTAKIDIQHAFHLHFVGAKVEEERELLIDYDPLIFGPQQAIGIQELQASIRSHHDHLQPISIGLDRMDEQGKAKVVVQLAHSIPLPSILKTMAFGLYRIWRRRFDR